MTTAFADPAEPARGIGPVAAPIPAPAIDEVELRARRLERLRSTMTETGVDLCLLTNPVSIRYVIPISDDIDDLEGVIMATCEENLPDFKRVRAVHIVDELPRSTLEKILKAELRARLPEITE